MKKTTIIFSVLACMLAGPNSLMASGSYLMRQVIVLNEGKPGVSVTVGAFNPSTHTYQNFDTIQAGFATDVIIDQGFIYVAADSILRKYDLMTKQILQTKVVKGIRELHIWHNHLLVSRGDIAPLPSYFQVYDKNDLSFVYEVTGISGAAAEVKAIGDTAYLAVNGFGSIGKLAVIDLQNHSLNREIDLGAAGLNPEAVRAENGKIFAVSSPGWSNSTVTQFDVQTTASNNMVLNAGTSCSASAMYNSNLYVQLSAENKLKVFSVIAANVWDSLATGQNAYGIGIDSVNARIYTGVTDFSTYGKVYIYNFYGAVLDSFDVNISPGTFAFDVVNTTSASQDEAIASNLNVYPNPANKELRIALNGVQEAEQTHIVITDLSGRIVMTDEVKKNSVLSLNTEKLAAGMYLLKAETANGLQTRKFLKN